ncbi:hypothetical protein G6F61_014602 [Rhizopus arrhizus]|nr:hypothetical protein G6F61_014602 [Rhizopus arrhizus]
MSVESLGLAPFLLRALAEQGYENPTPIQQQAIPLALADRRLRPAAAAAPGHRLAGSAQRPAQAARADPGPDPRTGHPGA